MPTGTSIQDPRELLFDAAERVLVRDGPNALTSRAVTTEASVAKGVLHRHFEDFDGFLAELVRDRIARIDALDPTGDLTDLLIAIFDPVAVAIVALVTSRHELLERLRATTPKGIPLLAEATTKLAESVPDASMLVGAAHLLFAGRPAPPTREEVRVLIDSVIRKL